MRQIHSWRLGLVAGFASSCILQIRRRPISPSRFGLTRDHGSSWSLPARTCPTRSGSPTCFTADPVDVCDDLSCIFRSAPPHGVLARFPNAEEISLITSLSRADFLALFAVWRLFVGGRQDQWVGAEGRHHHSRDSHGRRSNSQPRNLPLPLCPDPSKLGSRGSSHFGTGYRWIRLAPELLRPGGGGFEPDKLFEAIAEIRQRTGWRRALGKPMPVFLVKRCPWSSRRSPARSCSSWPIR